jgi:hypothetical protein
MHRAPSAAAVSLGSVSTDEPGTGDGNGASESPLDELFVAGARYQEPSARERERQAKEFQRQGREAARRNRRRKLGERGRSFVPWAFLAVITLVIWLVFIR